MDRRAVSGTALVAYVPVLHRGYLDFFGRYSTELIGVLGPELIAECDYLRKEIRALEPNEAARALKAFFPSALVMPLIPDDLREMKRLGYRVTMPDEDVCRQLAATYLAGCDVRFDPTFLRWDRTNTLAEHEVTADREIAPTGLDRELMERAASEASKSSDWWRQVGALLVRDGQVLASAHNRHVPTDYTPYLDGDPRNAFRKGVNIELGTALHAEKAVICAAARHGIRTEGAWLYVTTFPCPPCAKAVAACGIARVYFREGYAMLDGERVLRDAGVTVVRVR